MSAWFRAYCETLNDPKVQTLPLDAFKAWHNAMYLASSINSNNGCIGDLETIAFAFRETKSSVSSAFHPLLEAGLLVTVGETFQIVNWKKRQYKSDTSTERVKQHRKRSRNVTETAPDTDTDTDILLSKDNSGEVEIVDPRKLFFDMAKGYLLSAGVKNPGALVAKWLRDHGKDLTVAAINAAQLEKPIDPVAYIGGYFRRQGVMRDDRDDIDAHNARVLC